MSDFSFLAVPNIEGMRFLWYLKTIGVVLVFGVCLFFLMYFWIKYRKGKQLIQQLQQYDEKAQILEQQLFVQKIGANSGKQKLVLFIEYLERFVTTAPYANLSALLLPQGFTAEEIEDIGQVLYADKHLSKHIETKIMEITKNIVKK